ncbi:biotin--[acetyl-CoA-carboxylase] ligase [Sphingobacteriaceae bacterium WQ 2009]|uniref:Biotin--[acetyl-CoA-carboxylase] ligase n=1 Tax=Rhinopithecimicrobium faecis TaxID=2820698 RepID=A0A8T4H8N6_9SPHI|nr:biotin--[acetyl-CoA-carboxylase] ligase [Sphingobacteriaceae bacterium WQ 2009]
MQNLPYTERIIGRNIIRLDRVSSTNDFLKDYVAKFKPHSSGTAILAVDQFQGRGQRDNCWFSEPGKNIICSIHLMPNFISANQQFPLNIGISLGIAKYLQAKCQKTVKIKWPNDIYIENKKVAGILIENTIRGSHISQSIVGIGINVNQTIFHESISAHSTSLKLANNQPEDYPLTDLIEGLFTALNTAYLDLKTKDPAELLQAYNKLLFRRAESSTFQIGDSLQKGVIEEVCADGKLCVILGAQRQKFQFKEISLLLED